VIRTRIRRTRLGIQHEREI